jgi:hypothetical protein
VLSDSTEACGRGEKFMRSRQHPTVQEYVLGNTKTKPSKCTDARQRARYSTPIRNGG